MILEDSTFICTDLGALTHRDDEYAWAGVEDPKIVVTTSHNPSSRLKQFAKVRFERRLYVCVFVGSCLATKVFIGNLPAMGRRWVIILLL